MSDLCKCNKCGLIIWDESVVDGGTETCPTCHTDNCLTDLDGRYIDINELTENVELRTWCVNNRWTKHQIIEVWPLDGCVVIENYPHLINYKDII